MNLKAALAALLSRPTAQSINPAAVSPEQLRDFLRTGNESAAGVSVTESVAMKVATAWRCISLIADTIGTTPLDLVRRVGENRREAAIGHPLRRVLTVRPNQWQTSKEFRTLLQTHLLLRGNAFARKVRLGRDVVGLIPLHPDRVQPEQLTNLRMAYRVNLHDGQQVVLPQSEVFHLRGLSLDGVTGLSVIHYMREALGLSLQSEQASARLLKQGAFIGGLLKHPGKLSTEARQRIADSWRSRHSGADHAGSTPLLEEGMEYQPLGFSAGDMQFLEQRDYQRYDIATFFGVPPHMIGVLSKTSSWGSGLEQQSIGFVTYTLLAWFRTWEEAIKRDLMDESEWETLDARFYAQGLMRGDSKAREAYYRGGLQMGWLSPDEVRALEDMNPRLDGGGGIYYDPRPPSAPVVSEPSDES